MNAPDPHDPTVKPREGTIVQVKLGDGEADNKRLANTLRAMADAIDKDAPGTGGYSTREWLKRCVDPFLWVAKKAPEAVAWAVNRFTDREATLIKAQAEAEKTRAEAEKIRAEARNLDRQLQTREHIERMEAVVLSYNVKHREAEAAKIEAEADKIEAEAKEIRAKTGDRAKLIKLLKEKGIDWAAEEGEDGTLRIVFTKPDPIQSPPDDDQD